MKATGLIRRIDDLGRIVIPKEIRRTLRLHEGDPMEIFTDEGTVCFKKYSAIKELGEFSNKYARTLSETLQCTVLITDKETVLAQAGKNAETFRNKSLCQQFIEKIEEREPCVYDEITTGNITIVENGLGYNPSIIYPIIADGDVLGSIVLINTDIISFTVKEYSVVQFASSFIARQLEE